MEEDKIGEGMRESRGGSLNEALEGGSRGEGRWAGGRVEAKDLLLQKFIVASDRDASTRSLVNVFIFQFFHPHS